MSQDIQEKLALVREHFVGARLSNVQSGANGSIVIGFETDDERRGSITFSPSMANELRGTVSKAEALMNMAWINPTP